MVCEFKFTKLDVFLKIKPDSKCKYGKLKSSCEIHLTANYGNHELHFCDRTPSEKKTKDKL